MTLAKTAKKLEGSFYVYVFDRVVERNQIPYLSDLIRSRASAQVSNAKPTPNFLSCHQFNKTRTFARKAEKPG